MASNNSTNEDVAKTMVEMTSAASKANEVMNNVSAAIPQGTKDYVNSAKEKLLDSDKLRSFSQFFGIGEEKAFSFACASLFSRLKHNLFFFYLNYILLTALIFVITLLAAMLNPTTLLTLVCLAVGWFAVIRFTAEGEEGTPVAGGCSITRKQASFAMMVISGIVLFFLAKPIFLGSITASAVFSLIHAIFRDAEEHKLEESYIPPTAQV
mmetsp:Transcript_196/g.257  ORF Transcript_196/g.257 Transcript_196/m.257 type:complete len:210 (-) Transcript_196:126-755(-)